MKPLRRPRNPLPVLLCWPQLWPEADNLWYVFALQLNADGSLAWYLRPPALGPAHYDDVDAALADVALINPRLLESIDDLLLSPDVRGSLRLKVQKALAVEERLLAEERWMLDEAVRLHTCSPRPRMEDLVLAPNDEGMREALHSQLQRYPYLGIARLHRFGVTLKRVGDHDWTERLPHNRKTALYCSREKIAKAFGHEGIAHWGRTKAAIRFSMLPRANKLLQLAGFQQMLDEARGRGHRVVVCGGFVFWYEEDGVIGWVVKQLGSSKGSESGDVLWEEGLIVSQNHGRLVILPYIKQSGERVQGHTKNAPHDGRAKLRHPDHQLILPFEVLSGDFMYDLFGRLQYE